MLPFRHAKLRLAYGVGDNITSNPVTWFGAEVSVQYKSLKILKLKKLSPVTFEGDQCLERETLSANPQSSLTFAFSVLSRIS